MIGHRASRVRSSERLTPSVSFSSTNSQSYLSDWPTDRFVCLSTILYFHIVIALNQENSFVNDMIWSLAARNIYRDGNVASKVGGGWVSSL
jgi:hypothetical protein